MISLRASITGASLIALLSSGSFRYHARRDRPAIAHALAIESDQIPIKNSTAHRRRSGVITFPQDPLSPGSQVPCPRTSSSSGCSRPRHRTRRRNSRYQHRIRCLFRPRIHGNRFVELRPASGSKCFRQARRVDYSGVSLNLEFLMALEVGLKDWKKLP